MKATNFQDDISAFLVDNFEDHCALEFASTSMQDATERCHNSELVGEPMTLNVIFTFAAEHVTEVLVLGKAISSVPVDKLRVVEKKNN